MRVDVHQHIWTQPLLQQLAARDALPMVRYTDGAPVLYAAGEQPYVIEAALRRSEQQAGLLVRDGLDLALVAISSPIGIEALPSDHALELIEAHLDGLAELPDSFAAWGP